MSLPAEFVAVRVTVWLPAAQQGYTECFDRGVGESVANRGHIEAADRATLRTDSSQLRREPVPTASTHTEPSRGL